MTIDILTAVVKTATVAVELKRLMLKRKLHQDVSRQLYLEQFAATTKELEKALAPVVEAQVDDHVRGLHSGTKQFCPTGPGGGVDPTCGSGGARSPLKRREGFEYQIPVADPSPREYLSSASIKSMHPESAKVVLATLDRLVGEYGAPAGLALKAMRGGSAIGTAMIGRLRPVSPEEADSLHVAGEHILDMRIQKSNRAQYYHDDKTGYSISLQVAGPRGGAGYYGGPPEKFGKYASVWQTSLKTPRGPLDDVVTHEFGHVLSYKAGWTHKACQAPANLEIARAIKSEYAKTNIGETIAEAFKYYDAGGRDPKVVEFLNDTVFSKIGYHGTKMGDVRIGGGSEEDPSGSDRREWWGFGGIGTAEKAASQSPTDWTQEFKRAAFPVLADAMMKAATAQFLQLGVDIRKRRGKKAFCPTGPGGGVDPTCSPGGGKQNPNLQKAIAAFGPVLAEGVQDGYRFRIHDSHPGSNGNPVHILDDPEMRSVGHAGIATIESPKGSIIKAQFWMDWAEPHYPANYKELSKAERAGLEVEEQKKYGYKKMYQSRLATAREYGDVLKEPEFFKQFCPTGPGGGEKTANRIFIKSTATDWLDRNELTLPSDFVSDMPRWLQDNIAKQLKESFDQDYWEGMAQTTQDDIEAVLRTMSEGESISSMAKTIKEKLGTEYYHNRARNIARTEAANALNGARWSVYDDLMREVGPQVPMKMQWLSVLGTTTRDTHAHLDGVPADKDGLWYLGGKRIPWPGHYSLPPGERCNCQCTISIAFGMTEEEAIPLIQDYYQRRDDMELGGQRGGIEDLWVKQFCPTGPGGGVDPSCGSGGGSSRSNLISEVVAATRSDRIERSFLVYPGGKTSEIVKGTGAGDDATVDHFKDPKTQIAGSNIEAIHTHPISQQEANDAGHKYTGLSTGDLANIHSNPGISKITAVDLDGTEFSLSRLKHDPDSLRDLWKRQREVLSDVHQRHLDQYIDGKITRDELKVRARSEAREVIAVLEEEGFVSYTETRRSAKAFCPTGPGGGVDPTCSPGKASAPAPTIVLEGPQITKVKPLSGGSNAPTYIEYTDGSGRPQKGMFKADGDEATSPYYQAFPRGSQAAREVTASLIGKELGLGDAVASTQFAEVGGRRGVLQNWINDTAQVGHEYIDANFKGDRYSGDPAVAGKQVSKILEKVDGIEDMQYFDLLTGNADRHEGNWMVKGGKVAMIDNGATFASNEHYIAEGTGMRRQPRLRTLESSPAHSTGIQPMSSKFAEGVQKLLKNRDAISEQMAANGLKSKEIDSFWKRAEFLSKTRVFGFSQDTLMEFARLSEGIKNPWDRSIELDEKQFCPTGPGGGVDPTCSPGGRGDAKAYSKMNGEELHAEMMKLSVENDARLVRDKKERATLKAAFDKAEEAHKQASQPRSENAEAIAAAKEEWRLAEYGTPAASAILARLTELRKPANQEAFDATQAVMREAGSRLQEFNAASRASNDIKDRAFAMLRLDPEDRCKIESVIDSKIKKKEAVIKRGIQAFEELVHKSNFHGGVSRVYFEESKTDRASCSDNDVNLSGSNGKDVVVHELGHVLEHRNTTAAKAAIDFRRDACDGAVPKSLKTVSKSYRDDEKFRERTDGAKWIDPYMGKLYPGKLSTEITSMGLELLISDPVGFAARDPKMFKVVVDICRNSHKTGT